MKRNLRFWTRYVWESAEVDLVLVAILVVLTLLGATSSPWEQLAGVLPYYLFLAGTMCMFLCNVGVQSVYLPLLLSMGETRKNVFWGFQYGRLLTIVSVGVLSLLLWLLIPGEASAAGLQSMPSLLLFSAAISCLGNILGTLQTKCKWVSIVFIVILCGGLGGVVGGVFVNLGKNGLDQLMEFFTWLSAALASPPWWLVLATAILLAIDLVFHWLLLRRQEVKI